MNINPFAATALLALTFLAGSNPVWCADAASDAAQVKLQSVTIPKLKVAIASAAGFAAKDIEVKTTAHQITITVINSALNAGVAADREANAAKIAASVERTIADKAEFSQVAALHVDYVKRPGNDAKPIQGFDFFKSPAGAFASHKS